MKIFLSFLQSKVSHPIPAYSFWEYYIKNGIEESGNTWVELPGGDWALGIVPQEEERHRSWKERIWQDTLEFLRKNPADLFLSYLYPKQVDTAGIREIQKLGIPCVNFFCDNVREFTSAPTEFSVFDVNWVPEYKALNMYKQKQYTYLHLPMPMWVAPENRTISQNENNSVSFIGSHDIQRQFLFEELIARSPDTPLEIYGAGWQAGQASVEIQNLTSKKLSEKVLRQFEFISRQGPLAYIRKIEQRDFKPAFTPELAKHIKGKPDFPTYVRITQESAVTLGVNRYPSYRYPFKKPDTYSRLRDIEAPMLGACYLTEWTEGIENMYEIGTELLIYKDAVELKEHIKELLKCSTRRHDLRTRGQRRALHEHSIPFSLDKIRRILGGL